MNYIVTWIVLNYVIGTCPDDPKTNEFGVSSGTFMSCAVLHIEQKKTKNIKEFTNKQKAVEFKGRLELYSKTSKENTFSFSTLDKTEIIEIKLDSTNIQQP